LQGSVFSLLQTPRASGAPIQCHYHGQTGNTLISFGATASRVQYRDQQ